MKKKIKQTIPEKDRSIKAKLYEILEQRGIIPNEQTHEHMDAYDYIVGTTIMRINDSIEIYSRSGVQSWSLTIKPDGSSTRSFGICSFG